MPIKALETQLEDLQKLSDPDELFKELTPLLANAERTHAALNQELEKLRHAESADANAAMEIQKQESLCIAALKRTTQISEEAMILLANPVPRAD